MAEEYAVKFLTLAAQSGWKDAALWAVFKEGLNCRLKAEMAFNEESLTLISVYQPGNPARQSHA